MKSTYVLTGEGIKCGSVVKFTSRLVVTTHELFDETDVLQVIKDKLSSEGIEFLLEITIKLISIEEL